MLPSLPHLPPPIPPPPFLQALVDLHLLAGGDALVGALSGHLSRLALELMVRQCVRHTQKHVDR
jgi:hypothetical protein